MCGIAERRKCTSFLNKRRQVLEICSGDRYWITLVADHFTSSMILNESIVAGMVPMGIMAVMQRRIESVDTESSPSLFSGAARPDRRTTTWRSVLIGLASTACIAALSPWNDLLVQNTFLIGGVLPVGLMLILLLLVVLINAPLIRWRPRWALSNGELAAVVCIVLVGCAAPSTGFVTYLAGMLTGLRYHSAQQVEIGMLLGQLGLPGWVFPTVPTGSPAEQGQHPVVTWFVHRTPPDAASSVPWSAWLRPALAWGAFGGCLWGALLSLTLLVRRQWMQNERLPFPVAQVLTALVEREHTGRAFNSLLSSQMFWLSALTVVGLRSWNAMALYQPDYLPPIPLGFDLADLFYSTPPLDRVDYLFMISEVYFSVIGLTFFLHGRLAFSIWVFFVLKQLVNVTLGGLEAELTPAMQTDQMFGSIIVYLVLLVWIGRLHWAVILRSVLGRSRASDPTDPYVSYRIAVAALCVCVGGMIIWLVLAGCSMIGALVLVLMVLTLMMMISRIAAETGLYYVQLNVPAWRPWLYLLPLRTSSRSFFWTAFMDASFTHDTRESASVYMSHAMRLADDQQLDRGRKSDVARLICGMLLALFLAAAVGGSSTLVMSYSHATTLTTPEVSPENSFAIDHLTRNVVIDPTRRYLSPNQDMGEQHSHFAHVLAGAGITSLLGFLHVQYAGFVFHPMGFLLVYTYPVTRMWFSIFLGWLAKAVLLRFGGGQVYTMARPLFIGLIVGEALAAALWLAVTLVRVGMGEPFQQIYFTP
jgi:hypothetical protein